MPTVTVTMIAEDRLEERQAMWWRPVADAWPEGGPFVTLQPLTLREALENPQSVRGVAAVVFLDDGMLTGARLSDALYQRGVPAVFLAASLNSQVTRHNSDSVIVLREDESAPVIAATLRALAQRQPAVESALAEMAAGRRFQNGLRGEMDRVAEELQLAAQVQRDFLPRAMPAMPGVEFGVLFRPCGYVSGDVYDVLRLDEHHAGFFLADAIGHGVPAALLTMALCQTLPTKDITGSTYRIIPPAEALTRLNVELIRRQGESPRFASAVYGIVDVRTREVTLAGAGHPPPLRICGETVSKIDTPGGLLGVFADEVYGQTTFTLREDESLVIHSDGFETAFPDPGADAYGRRLPTMHYVEHLTQFAADAHRGCDMARAVAGLARRLDAQAGSLHQADDLSMLALTPKFVRRGPGDGVGTETLRSDHAHSGR